MKRTYLIVLLLIGCASAKADSWIQKVSLPAVTRAASFAFSIGDNGYIGGGINFTWGIQEGFWQFNPATNVWTQKADFGGGPRSGAVGFSIGTKGYALTGASNNGKQNDIWEYDTLANSWTQKTSLPSDQRNYAVAFSIGSKGYLGSGYTSTSFVSLNDFWQYDPATDSWTQKADIPGPQRSSAIGFSINGKGYIGTGDTCNYYQCFFLNDFYSYDTLANAWTPKSSLETIGRSDAAAFVINGKGYVCGGSVNEVTSNDLLEYNPITDVWTSRASIPVNGKESAFAFAAGNHGYVGAGYDPSFNSTNDLWEYSPDTSVETLANEITNDILVSVSPNPVVDESTITLFSQRAIVPCTLEIISAEGKRFFFSSSQNQNTANHTTTFRVSRGNPEAGIYFYIVKVKGIVIASGKLMVL